MKKLTATQEIVLSMFKKLYKKSKVCPTNERVSCNIGCSKECVRLNLINLAKAGYLKINKKLKQQKFYV